MSYGNDYQKTLRPGILIESKVSPQGGTLGCFARLASDASKIVLLSNSHVLYSDISSFGASGDGSEVGQPSVSCCLCCTCRVIGENHKNAFKFVTVKVTSPADFAGTYQGSEIDCAIARVNKNRPYTNEALYGMITGTPPAGSLGVAGGAPVEMVGSTTGPSKGKVLQLTTVATYQSGGSGSVPNILVPFPLSGTAVDEEFAGVFPSINQMLILPDPDPQDANRPMHFCGFGDSGSVLVNAAKQVVGIVTRAWPVSAGGRTQLNKMLPSPLPAHGGTLGIVSPIGPVLSELGIVIVNNMSGTVTSAGESVEELRRAEAEREEELALQDTLRFLEVEVRSKALGAAAMDALDRHRGEVLHLVNRKRQVAAVWRRNGGPAFAAHCLHSIRDHNYVIPNSIEGVTPIMLMEKMAAVLRRFGSAELYRDIDAYEQLAYEWLNGCNSVWQLVERMRGLENSQTGALASAVGRGMTGALL
jgi:hypothetical protein